MTTKSEQQTAAEQAAIKEAINLFNDVQIALKSFIDYYANNRELVDAVNPTSSPCFIFAGLIPDTKEGGGFDLSLQGRAFGFNEDLKFALVNYGLEDRDVGELLAESAKNIVIKSLQDSLAEQPDFESFLKSITK